MKAFLKDPVMQRAGLLAVCPHTSRGRTVAILAVLIREEIRLVAFSCKSIYGRANLPSWGHKDFGKVERHRQGHMAKQMNCGGVYQARTVPLDEVKLPRR